MAFFKPPATSKCDSAQTEQWTVTWTTCTNMAMGTRAEAPGLYYQDAQRNQHKSGFLQKPCNPCGDGLSYNFFQWDFEAVKKEGLCFNTSSIYLQENTIHKLPKEWCTRFLAQGLIQLHRCKICVVLWSKTRRNDSLPFLSILLFL